VTPLGLVLVAAGVVGLALGLLRIRAPLEHIRRLDETQANLDRYEAWRGRSTDVETDAPTGADEMRSLLRRRVAGWGIVCVVAVAAIVAGLLVR
jgi:hypothetical protein